VSIERSRLEPLLPLAFFGNRNFTAALVTNGVLHLSYLGGFTIAPFMVNRLFGYGTYKTSLIIAVRPVLFSAGAWYAGRTAGRVGSRRVQVTGSVLLTLGSMITAAGAGWRSLPLLLVGLGVVGAGVGYGRPANTTTITNSVSERDVGIATGVLNMTSQIGAAVGVTVLLAMVGDSIEPSAFVIASLAAAAVAAVSILTASLLSPTTTPVPREVTPGV
jgi:DHA2 family methylenomycin A resistance protein-like MFS transporter